MSTASALEPEQLATWNEEWQDLDAGQRIEWAAKQFGDELVLSTSFGIQSAVMLHLISQHAPQTPVIFIDTGYLFPETYRYADRLTELLDLNLKVYQPQMTPARQEALFGKRWEQGKQGLQEYGLMNKVEPMNRALRELGATAWLSGLRRVQASTREQLQYIERQNKTTKLYPILEWSERDVYYYMQQHELPQHPLWDQGYVSVGDVHSTRPLEAGMNPEDTRFGGLKRECGLHEISGNNDYQI
ncbi:MAG: phosphoadenosine phosphosulfate reductase [Puniceicoccaceae bacterium 5H]|nr:MAG: phosphoadenosine phosphosulfate reductase [Puniceicoccaceae bacterium 5H]